MQEIGLGLRDLGGDPGVRQHPQPLDRPFRRHAIARRRLMGRQVRPKLAETFEVGRVVDPFGHVIEGEVAHLAFDPRPIETNRSVW
jgi:hypothetical protein